MKASGILFLSGDNVLFTKRGMDGDPPGEWALPGGKIENGETAEQAAIRECEEEIGYSHVGPLIEISKSDVGGTEFTTFFTKCAPFTPVLNEENTEFKWTDIKSLPEPMHPGVTHVINSAALKKVMIKPMTELDIARQIQSGELTSPQRFGNVWLFDIRITGTGTSYRSKGDEFVYRPPQHYLTEDFLARCNGLPVIWQHPVNATLDSKEFADRIIGSIFIPYLKMEEKEVWGIAKIYDDEAADNMQTKQLSTSPTVVFQKLDGNSIIALDDGTNVLIEGNPSLLDHVAICENGVWDKGGEPSGVLSDCIIKGDSSMTPEELKAKADAEAKEKEESDAKAKADAEGDKMDKILAACDSIGKRMDAYDAKAKADAEEAELKNADPKQVAADKAKADAEAEEEEKKKADAQAKADADEIRKRVADVEAKLPKEVSDADFAAMADCQARADSVASAFGDSASRPVQGETVLGYRKRLAAKFKAHSKDYASVDISAITDPALFGIVENKIYADAMDAANSPVTAPGEGLREIKTRTAAGHQISTFKGNIGSWMGEFKADAFHVDKINTGVR